MPKIDFYLMIESGLTSRLQLACRLIEKAFKQQHRIYLHMMSQRDAHTLDELLWTYREDSFLPHNLYGEGPEPAPPIQIGYNATPEKHRDILINLADSVPSFYQQFQRVLEIVSSDTETQDITREHYRFYRAQGCKISTHKLETASYG